METIDGLDFDEAGLPDELRPLVRHYRRYEESLTHSLAQAAMEAQIELKDRAL